METMMLEMSSYMGKNMVNLTIENEGELDRIACKVLKNDCPPFVAPFSEVEINGKTILRYDVGKLVGLSYFSSKLSRPEFLKLWGALLAPLTDCGDWFMRYDAFCFDPQYVFLDRHTLEVFYLYLPLVSAVATNSDIKALFTGLMERCELTDGQQLQIELYKFFARSEFSVAELRDIIDRNRGGTAPVQQAFTQPVQQPVYPTPPVTPPPAGAPAYTPVQQPVAYSAPVAPIAPTAEQSRPLTAEEAFEQELLNSMNGVKGAKEKKPIKAGKPPKEEKAPKPPKEHKPLFGGFGKKDPKPVKTGTPMVSASVEELLTPVGGREVIRGAAAQYSAPPPQHYAPTPTAGDDVTELLDGDNHSGGAFLYLASPASAHNLPQRFELDFSRGAVSVGRFDTGKGVRQSDVEFAPTVKSVSRSQARIEKQGEQFFLIDLGSTNGTYLNGVRLAPSMPTAIKSGDCVGFSDKGVDYIFNV